MCGRQRLRERLLLLGRWQLDDLDLAELDYRARIVALQGEMALREGVLLVHVVHRRLAVLGTPASPDGKLWGACGQGGNLAIWLPKPLVLQWFSAFSRLPNGWGDSAQWATALRPSCQFGSAAGPQPRRTLRAGPSGRASKESRPVRSRRQAKPSPALSAPGRSVCAPGRLYAHSNAGRRPREGHFSQDSPGLVAGVLP